MTEEIGLDVTSIAHGGVCVARHEGRVIFVADAIPGERVQARLDPDQKGDARFWRATAVEVLEPSPHRRAHFWPEAGIGRAPADRVGGADLGHIELAHQRLLKQRVLADALDRFGGGGLNAPEVRALDDSDGTRWRTRLTLHSDGGGRVGPYAARSHRIVEVDDHPLARPAIVQRAASLRAEASGRITLVESGDGEVRVIPPGAPSEQIWEQVGEHRFTLDAAGFWQVHPLAATALDAEVRSLLAGRIDPDAVHLDLYGGVGLFAATLSDLGAPRVVTVESDARASAHAAANLTDAPVEAVTARVDRYLARRAQPRRFAGGAVVLDPPRAGAGRQVVEAISALRPAAIVYVACDPVALARDLGTFREQSWEVADLRALDLFPHSHHFETLALLTRP